MDVVSVWLIHHKASMEESSPMNLDGSTYMVGIGVVPASDMKQALSRFDEYLADNKMAILELEKCEQWDSANFAGNSFEERQINGAAGRALETGKIHYTLGESSESIECDEDDD